MQNIYYTNTYDQPQYNLSQNNERFIGPIFPFLGGALIGYIAGRPQYSYPIYYPYYPYYPNYYYQRPNTSFPYTTSSMNYSSNIKA